MDMGPSMENLQMTTLPEEKKSPNFLKLPSASQLGVGPSEPTTSILYVALHATVLSHLVVCW